MFTSTAVLDIPRDLAAPSCFLCRSEHQIRSAEFRPPEALARQLGRRLIGVDLCPACSTRADLDEFIGACLLADA